MDVVDKMIKQGYILEIGKNDKISFKRILNNEMSELDKKHLEILIVQIKENKASAIKYVKSLVVKEFDIGECVRNKGLYLNLPHLKHIHAFLSKSRGTAMFIYSDTSMMLNGISAIEVNNIEQWAATACPW